MNFAFQWFANFILKMMTGGGVLPDGNWKTIFGYGLAFVLYVSRTYFGVEVPVLGGEWAEFIAVLFGTFGLGHKAGGKAV